MAEAVVLKNGRVVRTSNFDVGSMKFFNSGKLKSFKRKGKLITATVGENSGIYSGYWELEKIYDYKAGLITKSDYELGRFTNLDFIDAIPNEDIIVYEKRVIQGDNWEDVCFKKYNLTYTGQNFYEIPIPAVGVPIGGSVCDRIPQDSNAWRWYDGIRAWALDYDDFETVLHGANLAQLIYRIDYNIVQDYLQSDATPILNTELFNNEKGYYFFADTYDEFFEMQTLAIRDWAKAHYNNLFKFYTQYLINKRIIERSPDEERKVSVCMGMNIKSLLTINYTAKIEVLKYLARERLSRIWEKIDEENLAVKIILSFDETNFDQITPFLNKLIEEKVQNGNYEETLFQRLYDTMSRDWNITEGFKLISNYLFETNWEVEDTKGGFTKAVYRLWVASIYNPYTLDENPVLKPNMIGIKKRVGDTIYYEEEAVDANLDPVLVTTPSVPKMFYYTRYGASSEEEHLVENALGSLGFSPHIEYTYPLEFPDAAPLIIDYRSRKLAGTYNDNYNFKFKGEKITANEIKPTEPANGGGAMSTSYYTDDVLFGTYDIYQPITVANFQFDSKVKFSTTDGLPFELDGKNIESFIPIFLLKYIDDAGDRSDFETIFGAVLDYLFIVTPIGLATKFWHLRHLSKFNYARAVFSIGEISGGTLNFLLNIVDDTVCNNSLFCKALRGFATALEIVSISLDGTMSLSRKIKNINDKGKIKRLQQAAENVKKEANEIAGVTDPNPSIEVSTQNVKNVISNIQDSDYVEEIASVIVLFSLMATQDINKFFNKIDAGGFTNLLNKVQDIQAGNADLANTIASYLTNANKKYQDFIFTKLEQNISWLDAANSAKDVAKLESILNILYKADIRIVREPVNPNSGRGFSYKVYTLENLVSKKPRWIETPDLLHTDDTIRDMIAFAQELNIPGNMIEGFMTRVFRAKKTKSVTQFELEMTNYSQLIKPVSEGGRGGLLYCFPTEAIKTAFYAEFKARYIDKYGLAPFLDEVFVGGSTHTKILPPDIDIGSYLSKNKMKRLKAHLLSVAQEARDKGLMTKQQFRDYTKGINRNFERKIKGTNTFQEPRIFSDQIISITSTIEDGQTIYKLNNMGEEYKYMETFLTMLNLAPGKAREKLDFVLLTKKAAKDGASIPPETIINFN